MIVNIAGTSGSGKSHLVREFIKWADQRGVVKPVAEEGVKLPIGYDVILKKSKTIRIIGPYEKADTAGCDVWRNVDRVYAAVADACEAGKHVLFEGLFMMNMTRGPQLVEEFGDVYIIQLADPLAVCLASIDERRKARGEGPLLNKTNTIANYKRAENYSGVMRGAGATIWRVKRADALGVLLKGFGHVDLPSRD